MIFNVDDMAKYNSLKLALTYDDLISVAKTFKYDKDVYTENHHIVPKCEGGSKETVRLPVKYHFLAHIFRAKEATNTRISMKNYMAANLIAYCKFRGKQEMEQRISDVLNDMSILYEVKAKMREHFLSIRADIDKQKIPIVCLETGEFFESLHDAAKLNGLNLGNLHGAVMGHRNKAAGKHWAPYIDGMSVQEELEHRIENEYNKKRHKKSYFGPLILIETGEEFATLKNAYEAYPKDYHIWDVCEGKRKITNKHHWKWKEELL